MIRDPQQQSDPPPGYRLHARYLGYGSKGTGLAPGLLIDERLAQALAEEAKRQIQQEIAEKEELEAARRREYDAREEATQALGRFAARQPAGILALVGSQVIGLDPMHPPWRPPLMPIFWAPTANPMPAPF